GQFQVMLPPNRSYRVQPYAFGQPAAPATSFAVAGGGQNIGDLTMSGSAHLVATVETSPGTAATYAELVIVPFTTPSSAASPSLYGLSRGCNPLPGPPHGGSPACNRALTHDGKF